MNIGEAAKRSGVTAKMIRYYESIGLLSAAARRRNGYRDYGAADVSVLQFVRRARDLGFSLEKTADLLALWRDRDRSSREVKRLAEIHIGKLEQRIRELRAMKDALQVMVRCCHGEDRPDCPILLDLAGGVEA